MLAILGGTPVRDTSKNPWPQWPVSGEEERRLLLQVLESGVWSYNGPRETAFNTEFARFIGTKHSLLVANGTVSLQLALEALDIGVGDEVIVPGITWQATAAAVLDINAVPILVDVDPQTWCVSPRAIEEAITDRTRAIMPVHLYGSTTDMDAVMEIADRHNLYVIEDAAHKHGASWRGRRLGSIGHIGSFSMQLSKVLTGGEGGALTTSDTELWTRLDALRNCGRRPVSAESSGAKQAGFYKSAGDFVQSGNYRATEFQAAVLEAALKRLPEQNRRREQNAAYLSAALLDLAGVAPIRRDERETETAYFNYAFRFDSEGFGGLPVSLFRKALSQELGIPVEACYEPLNDCTLYRPHTKKRYHISTEHWAQIDPGRFSLPVAEKIFRQESVTMHHSVLMGNRKDMDDIIEAITRIARETEALKQNAR
ncbi:DegT/DnrJ/EryC1/StrS family aminotransferase [Salinispira pacifica]